MTRARAIVVAVILVAAGVGAVALGRHEARAQTSDQVAGIRRVLAAAAGRTPDRYRLGSLRCLIYPVEGNPIALEVCADRSGRVLDASDRRGGWRFYSLRFDTAAAPRIDVRTLARPLSRLQRNADGTIWSALRQRVRRCVRSVDGAGARAAADRCSSEAAAAGMLATAAGYAGPPQLAVEVQRIADALGRVAAADDGLAHGDATAVYRRRFAQAARQIASAERRLRAVVQQTRTGLVR